MKWLSLLTLLNFCDWVIALFISGTAARIEGKDGKRTFLAVGLAMFFGNYALIRLGEFINLWAAQDEMQGAFRSVSPTFRTAAILIGAAKTLTLLFTWFVITIEKRERQGITSGNVIRNTLVKVFDRLR